ASRSRPHRRDRRRPPGALVRPPNRRFLPACYAELREDLGDVVLDGVTADAKAFGDLGVREAVAEEAQDFPLTRCEDVRVRRPTSSLHGSNLTVAARNYTTQADQRSRYWVLAKPSAPAGVMTLSQGVPSTSTTLG